MIFSNRLKINCGHLSLLEGVLLTLERGTNIKDFGRGSNLVLAPKIENGI